MSKVNLEQSWLNKLHKEFNKDYMKSLKKFLKKEINNKKNILTSGQMWFNALNSTKFENVKVVILGQDPYHGKNQAHGLSFSVQKDIKAPPSLQNIFKELKSDLGLNLPNHGNLEKWTKEGVLLLNSVLTVEHGKPGSHANKGWEKFTDKVLYNLNYFRKNIVYILWGKKAFEKAYLINQDENMIIHSSHPSPYSANYGFLGSRPFSRANNYLEENKIEKINWDLNE